MVLTCKVRPGGLFQRLGLLKMENKAQYRKMEALDQPERR